MPRTAATGAPSGHPGRPVIRVDVLGELRVRDAEGANVALPLQLRRLLGVLVAAGAAPVPGVRLADQITDGRPDSSAVRTAVSRLRRILGDRIETRPTGYRLLLEPGELDAERFVDLTTRATDAAGIERQQLLRDALDLWRGPAFGDLRDESWALGPARRLEELRATAIEDLADLYVAGGHRSAAIRLLSELVLADPYRERPVGLLMQQLAEDGRLIEALREFQRLRTVLAGVGLEPSAGLRRIEAALLADTTESRPSIEEAAGNLRRPVDPFVGRERELKALVETVASRRLVTVVGAGGVGKTRLAVEAAAGSSPTFSSGVWFVPLVSLSDDGDVFAATMTVLNVGADAGRSPIDSIIDRMRRRTALIVLDNAEHLIEGCAALASALLRDTDEVHLIVTSREPLGIQGEHVHFVAPLDPFDSVDLFCSRAYSADDRFECSESDRSVIEDICSRLDHLPLAIELAAARTRTLTVAELQERLDEASAMPHRRDAADHHATMRAAIDWSYRLLDDDERAVFDVLGLFAGSFDLAAASEVCGAGAAGEPDPSVVVPSLANRSMVMADRSGPTTRYSLLETIRRFSLERLAIGPSEREVRARYVAYFAGLASDVHGMNIADPRRAATIATLDWDNFRDALHHALDDGEVERAASIAVNLAVALDLGRHEHARFVLDVLALLPDGHRWAPILHCLAGWWANLSGDHRRAILLAERGLRCPTTIHRSTSIPLHIVIAEARVHLGDPAGALEAVQVVLGQSDDDHQIRVVFILGCWAAWTPRPDMIAGFAARIAEVAGRTGRYDDLHQAAYCEGIALLVEGDALAAIERFRAARRHCEGYPNLEAEALQGLTLAMAAAKVPEACDAFLDALAATASARMLAHWWMVVETLAIHWADEGRLASAAVLLGGLEAHDRACVFLVDGRKRAVALVADLPEIDDYTVSGRSMSRIELADRATALLMAERDQVVGTSPHTKRIS